jgi:RNA polymerase sigma-70 factor (ECF subfamily)
LIERENIAAEDARDVVDAVYRSESRQIFATLVRLLGDFDLAEEALHDSSDHGRTLESSSFH